LTKGLSIRCKRVVLALLILPSAAVSRAQSDSVRVNSGPVQIRMMTEGTITYKLSAPGASPEEDSLLAHSAYVLSLKGSRVRTDFTGPLGSTTTIYSSFTHAGALLREYGQEKLLVPMDKEDFEDLGKEYRSAVYTQTGDTATIAGYPCKKALGRTPAGDTLTIWYSPDLLPQNKEYSYRFSDLPGLPLAYESMMGKVRVSYLATRVSLEPVLSAKFDVPRTGYRELSYSESKKIQ
jgi:hypothetical protein